MPQCGLISQDFEREMKGWSADPTYIITNKNSGGGHLKCIEYRLIDDLNELNLAPVRSRCEECSEGVIFDIFSCCQVYIFFRFSVFPCALKADPAGALQQVLVNG